MADIDRLSIRIAASTATAVRNVNNLANALANLNSQLNAINPSRLNSATQSINSFNNAASGLRTAGRSVQSVVSGMSNVGQSSTGVRQATDATRELSNTASRMRNNVGGAISATRELGQSGQQGANGVRELSNATRSVARNAQESTSSIRSFGKATQTASFTSKGFVKELTRIGKMLKLMITRMVLRKVIQGVLDGFKNLAQYSSTFNATLSLLWNDFRQLGNSIAAAVSPLLNAFAPAIHYIIQLCIKAVNVINQLISALTGMSTWTRAKTLTDDYAKSLDKSNKSAKALKKTVLGFDELNQLQDNNSGGGGGGTDPKNMFEEVPIDKRILDFIDALKAKIADLKKYWDAFVKGFLKGLGDWKSKVALIIDGIARIQKALKDIWNDPEVSAARERYFLSLAEMLGAVAGTVLRIGLNIGANLAQGIAQALENKSQEIKDYLVNMFDIGTSINQQIEKFVLAIGRISDVLVGENAISATTHFTEIFTEAFMLITENAAKLGEAIVNLVTQPLIDNQAIVYKGLDNLFGLLSEFADFIQGLISDVRKTLSDVWESHLNPMFKSITNGISTIVRAALQGWNSSIYPVLRNLIETLKELWQRYLKPIFDDVCHIIATIGNLVAKLFNTIIAPLISQMVGDLLPRVRDGLNVIITWVKLLLQVWSTAFEQMLWVIRNLLEFVEIGFTEGWDRAWDHLAESWTQHWEDMKEKVRDILNSIIELVENAINAIVNGVNAIGNRVGSTLSHVSFPSWLGGGSFSLDIPHLNRVSLDRFANGGFPSQGSMFLAGESGAELVGNINGKTAVANNEQITNGIAQAVFNAITSANAQGGSEHYINNTIYVDDVAIARAVTKGQDKLNRRYSPTMA